MAHPQLIHKHGKPNLESPDAAPSMKPKDNPIALIKLNNPKQTKKLTSNQCMVQAVYTYNLTAGRVLPCYVILQSGTCTLASPSFPASCVTYKRVHLPPFQSLSQQHCIWKRIRKKGKADGTGMYMWTTHHEEHWLLVSKACFLQMSPHVHSYRWWLSAVNPAMRFLAEDENPAVQTNDCTDALLKTGFSFGRFQDQHSRKARRMSEACTSRRCLMSVRECSLVPLSQFHSGSVCNWYPFGLFLCASSRTPGSS